MCYIHKPEAKPSWGSKWQNSNVHPCKIPVSAEQGENTPPRVVLYNKGEELKRVSSFERLGNLPRAVLFDVVTALLSKDGVPTSQRKRQQVPL